MASIQNTSYENCNKGNRKINKWACFVKLNFARVYKREKNHRETMKHLSDEWRDYKLSQHVEVPRNNCVNELDETARKRVQGLVDHGWIDSDTINCYMKLLQQVNPYVYAFRTHLVEFLTPSGKYNFRNLIASRRGKQSIRNWNLDFKGMDAYNIIFFTVNLRENHWILIAFFIGNRTVKVFDSLVRPPKITEQVIIMIDHLQQFLEDEHEFRTGDELGENWEEWFVENGFKTVNQQDNCNDCGIFMLQTAKHLATNKSLNSIVPKNVPRFRAEIESELF